MTDKELRYLEALQKIGRELTRIREVLEAEKAPAEIFISKDGIVTKGTGIFPDLESYFERQEDDRK